MFEQLINEAATGFNLSTTSVAGLLRSLLALMTNEKTGGAEGFVDLFRRAGLGDVISSWFGGNEGKAITAPQIESALGTTTLDRLSASAGVGRGIVASALTYLLPKVIGRLTPGGYLPSNSAILSQVSSFLDRPFAADREAARPVAGARPMATEPPVTARVDAETRRGGWPAWLPWAVVAALALAALLWFRAPAGNVEPQLTLSNQNGRITYSGAVRDEATGTRIVNSLQSTFGAANIEGDLRIDRNVKRAEWLPRVDEIFSALKTPGTEFRLNGDDIRVGGWLSAEDRQAATNALSNAFGGVTVGSLGDAATDAVRAANSKAITALRAVGTTGVTSTGEVVKVLNMSIINFPSGSAEIPGDAMEIIRSSAEALKRVPEGSAIEIGGHTDSSGDGVRNLELSQARADAVRRALVEAGVPESMLRAKGYGDTKPRARNDSEQGRFLNRRIEYSVVSAAEAGSQVR